MKKAKQDRTPLKNRADQLEIGAYIQRVFNQRLDL
jgi:hypothetical protein